MPITPAAQRLASSGARLVRVETTKGDLADIVTRGKKFPGDRCL